MEKRIEEEVFYRYQPDRRKLKAYGFSACDKGYIYEESIMDNAFKVQVFISKNDKVTVKVIDSELNEEYTNIYTKNYGAYVSQVREALQSVLEDIRDKCFEKGSFVYDQSKRIASYIKKQYGIKEENLWKSHPEAYVFSERGKWFAVIEIVKGKKPDLEEGEYEVLEVMADERMIDALKDQEGFHEAIHLNRDKYLSIILNDTVDDEIIFSLIDASYQKSEKTASWIVPANPEYYDVIGVFEKQEIVSWKQSSRIQTGDIVYIYVAKPYSSIMFKCEAVETDIPYDYKDRNVSIRTLMNLRVLKRYKKDVYNYDFLKDNGLKMVRGPVKISEELAAKLS